MPSTAKAHRWPTCSARLCRAGSRYARPSRSAEGRSRSLQERTYTILLYQVVVVLALVLATGSLIPLDAQPTELVVKRDCITAGLLATIIPTWAQVEPSTVLAYAPRPGARREVHRAELLRWGHNQGIELDADQIPASLLVRRATRQLTPEEAERYLIESLADAHEISPEQLSVELVNFRAPLIPGGELRFDLLRHSLVLNRAVPLSLRWTDTDNHTGQVALRASVTIHGTFAVAREHLSSGSELTIDALDFETGPLPGAPERFALSEDDLVGTKLRGSVRAGQPLDRRLLVVSETIERGDLIQIRVHAGAIVLQTPAAAEESGSIGDIIRCRNLDSGQRISARVVSAKLAEVAAR